MITQPSTSCDLMTFVIYKSVTTAIQMLREITYISRQDDRNMAVHIKVSPRRQSSVGNFHCFPTRRMSDNRDFSNEDTREQCPDDDTIILNVGGQIFETFQATLFKKKRSKLSNVDFLRSHYRLSHDDYFFDRDPDAFKCVLSYCRTNQLHVPATICGPVMKRELRYWGVDDEEIERCCWGHYNTWNSQNDTLDQLERDIQFTGISYKLDPNTCTSWQKMKSRIWNFLENPTSSKAAKVYTWVSILVVILSIFTFCAETHPFFQVEAKDDLLADFFVTDNIVWTEPSDETTISSANQLNTSTSGNGNVSSNRGKEKETTHFVPHATLIMLDFMCLTFFTVEFGIRLFFSPIKKTFLSSPLNLIDLVAVLPDYIELIVLSLDPDERKVASFVDFIFILRIIRVLRVFRLIRHIPGLWILLFTVKASINELILMMVFLMIGMLVFAALIYFAEGHTSTHFTNIPIGFWWSLVTMTTVGYGDVYPQTGLGYVVGALCALVGLLMLALTVPIIVGNFVLYYTHIQYILNRKVKCDMIDDVEPIEGRIPHHNVSTHL